ncbi:MAG: DNA polymerase III subunit beta [Patescibacteria group bacterium]|jgi:DNA polymerase-3 subunit beta
MQFSCTQENLVQGLSIVSHITGKNINLPVLGNVLIKAEKSGINFYATNLEISIGCTVRGKVDVEGEYSVPAKLLFDYISLLASGKVEFELKDNGLEVRSNGQDTVLRGMLASEFPLLPKPAKNSLYQLNANEVKQAINQVVFASSTSESRPELSGVACFFNPAGLTGKMAMVATDSYRLAERIVGCKEANKTATIIVPARAMSEIGRVLSAYKDELEPPENVGWSINDNQLVVSYGTVELTTRLIEANFPDYQNIIPSSFKTEVVLSRQDLMKAVKAASLFSRKEINDVHLSFAPEKGECTIESSDEGTGKTKTVISGSITGDENQVVLNFKYLFDGLNSLGSDKITLSVISPMSPVLALPIEEDKNYRYLVMPIRQ